MTILLSFLTFGPYHLARLSAAQTQGAADGINVRGLAMSRVDSEYSWKTGLSEEVTYAVNDSGVVEVSAGEWLKYLAPVLDEIKPDVCAVAGYSHPAMLALASLCMKRSIPWILMSDSREVDLPRTRWREWSKGRIVRLASSGFAAGTTHIEYLEKLGLEKGICTTGYDVVDNNFFGSEADRWRAQKVETSGDKVSPTYPYFLAANRFIPKKNLFRLLDAYARYANSFSPNTEPGTNTRSKVNNEEHSTPWSLCLLGNGELKSDLIAHAHEIGLKVIEHAPWDLETLNLKPQTQASQPTVFLPGFRQIDELPHFYAHAGAFVHASTTEQWGLVVNEAMASGLPVIVSTLCGCTAELVRDQVNGFTFNPYEVGELSALLRKVSTMDEPERNALGEAGKELIAEWGLERFATGLRLAAAKAIKVGPKQPSTLDRFLLYFLSRR